MAVTFFIIAIVVNFAAKKCYANSSMLRAIITQGVEKSSFLVTDDNIKFGEFLEITSVFFAVLGVISWFFTAVKKEQCRHSILVILFAFFMLMLFAFVLFLVFK